jgi:hypothetical protein
MFVDMQAVERCAHCHFTVSAALEEARQAFQAHQCNRPKPETTVRPAERLGDAADATAGHSLAARTQRGQQPPERPQLIGTPRCVWELVAYRQLKRRSKPRGLGT